MPRLINILEYVIIVLLIIVGSLLASTIYIEYSSVIRWTLGISGALLALSVSTQVIIQQIIKG